MPCNEVRTCRDGRFRRELKREGKTIAQVGLAARNKRAAEIVGSMREGGKEGEVRDTDVLEKKELFAT